MIEAAVYLTIAVVVTAAFLPIMARKLDIDYHEGMDVFFLWFMSIILGLVWPLALFFALFILAVKTVRAWIDQRFPPGRTDSEAN